MTIIKEIAVIGTKIAGEIGEITRKTITTGEIERLALMILLVL